jgi:hypothetical protein
LSFELRSNSITRRSYGDRLKKTEQESAWSSFVESDAKLESACAWLCVCFVLPSDFFHDFPNKLGPLGEITLATGDLRLGVPSGEFVVALVGPIGDTYTEIPEKPMSYLLFPNTCSSEF